MSQCHPEVLAYYYWGFVDCVKLMLKLKLKLKLEGKMHKLASTCSYLASTLNINFNFSMGFAHQQITFYVVYTCFMKVLHISQEAIFFIHISCRDFFQRIPPTPIDREASFLPSTVLYLLCVSLHHHQFSIENVNVYI